MTSSPPDNRTLLMEQLYRAMYRIRRFEETVLENFPKGIFKGTTHTYLGQEANAVGVLHHLQAGDIVFSNHRCHGHFLAYGGDMRALFAELMGKASGVCGGRGGSQHLHWGNFYSNGIQGGIVPVATGMALAEKLKDTGAIAVCFLGDGTLGEGVIYESFNLASLWGAPVLYVVEDNRIAQTTPVELALAGDIPARFQAFGIPAREMDTSGVCDLLPAVGEWARQVRETRTPRALILHTCRFGPHSKGDDTRPEAEVAALRERRDPLRIHAPHLEAPARARIEEEVAAEVAAAFQQALADPLPRPVPFLTPAQPAAGQVEMPPALPRREKPAASITVLQSLNDSLHHVFQADERVYLIGEDLLDPYGGAFKVSRGLSEAYPRRVLPTPISEAGIVGVATGMALRGLRPIVEIMFGDFIPLIADQLVNHSAKFRWMYNEQVRVPLVIRTPMGGRRSYGPTHSQTLEKMFLGVPGLRVLAPCKLGQPGDLLARAVLEDQDPVLFIENKLLYLERLADEHATRDFEIHTLESAAPGEQAGCPTFTLKIRGAPAPVLTIAAYGHMASMAMQAARTLAYDHEIFTELVVPTQLSPFEIEPLTASVRHTQRLLAVEEGTFTLGWGAEILARAAEALGPHLQIARRMAAQETPVPASGPLEAAALPNPEDIVKIARSMV